jgi:hypothetical protein
LAVFEYAIVMAEQVGIFFKIAGLYQHHQFIQRLCTILVERYYFFIYGGVFICFYGVRAAFPDINVAPL